MKKIMSSERLNELSYRLVDHFMDFCTQNDLFLTLDKKNYVTIIKIQTTAPLNYELLNHEKVCQTGLFQHKGLSKNSTYIAPISTDWSMENKLLINHLLIYLIEKSTTVHQCEMIEYYFAYYMFGSTNVFNLKYVLQSLANIKRDRKKIVVWSKLLKMMEGRILQNILPQQWQMISPYEIVDILKNQNTVVNHQILKKTCTYLMQQKQLDSLKIQFNLTTVICHLIIDKNYYDEYEELLSLNDYSTKRQALRFKSNDDIKIEKFSILKIDLSIFLNTNQEDVGSLIRYVINAVLKEFKADGLIEIEIYTDQKEYYFYIHTLKLSSFNAQTFAEICMETLPNLLRCDPKAISAAAFHQEVSQLLQVAQNSILAWKVKKMTSQISFDKINNKIEKL